MCPFVKIAEQDARRGMIAVENFIVQKPFDLLAAFKKSRAEMNIINMQKMARINFNINMLAAARLAPANGHIKMFVFENRKARQHDIAVNAAEMFAIFANAIIKPEFFGDKTRLVFF